MEQGRILERKNKLGGLVFGGKVSLLVTWSPLVPQHLNLSGPGRSSLQSLLVVHIDSCQNLAELEDRHPYWRLSGSGKILKYQRKGA